MSNSTGTAPLPEVPKPIQKVSQTTLLVSPSPTQVGPIELIAGKVTVWVLCSIAVAFVAARIVVRVVYSKRLFSDDYFCLLALSILIGNSVLTQLMVPPMYTLLEVSAQRQAPGADFLTETSFYLKAQFASTVLFWSCLWAVKGCFLAFFCRLTDQIKWPRIAWWAVTIITVLAYIGSVITYPVSCTSFTVGECSEPINIERSLVSLRYSTAVDIITDLMIMALPLWLILGLKMSLQQKIGLVAVLSLGVIIIVFSVIRIIVTNTVGEQPEISWLALWSSIESSIAVIVACLASFKVLLSSKKSSSYGPSGGQYPGQYGNISNSRKAGGNRRSIMGTSKSGTTRVGHRELTSESYDDTEMNTLGGKYSGGTITITGGKGPKVRKFGDKEWDDDQDSQQQILHGDDIRVQTTWNVSRD